MRLERRDPPREFEAGGVTIRHSADLELEPDEQVSFVAPGTEWDVVRKGWGYYATPSVDARLPEHGLRAALAANAEGHRYVLLVERGREPEFEAYLAEQEMTVVSWLDQER